MRHTAALVISLLETPLYSGVLKKGAGDQSIPQSSPPQVPYNTLLDFYVLMSMVILFVCAFLSVTPAFFLDHKWISAEYVNYAALACSSAMIFALFVGWSARAAWVARSIRKASGRPVHEVEGKEWYAFQYYALPHFLR